MEGSAGTFLEYFSRTPSTQPSPPPPPPYIIHKYNIENVLWQKKNDAIRLNFPAHVHPALSLVLYKDEE